MGYMIRTSNEVVSHAADATRRTTIYFLRLLAETRVLVLNQMRPLNLKAVVMPTAKESDGEKQVGDS